MYQCYIIQHIIISEATMDAFFPFIYQRDHKKEEQESVFLYIEEEPAPLLPKEEFEEERVTIIEVL
jgi:hypothetical protein